MTSETLTKRRMKIRQNAGSLYFLYPEEFQQFLELDKDDNIDISIQEGKKGKFIAIWKVEEE